MTFLARRTCKRALESEETSIAKKRAVLTKTVEKWVLQSDRDWNTSLWLKFEHKYFREGLEAHHVSHRAYARTP